MSKAKIKNIFRPRTFIRMLERRFLGHPVADLTGGLMAAIVALPLCLAFGVASGMGAQAGLYGAIACGIMASVFGGTPGQCSGPTGPMTVVAAAVLTASDGRTELVFAVVIVAGILQVAFGYLKAAQLIHYLPYPVLSGFMIGIGVIIFFIQLAPLFGLPGTASVLTAIHHLPMIPFHWNRDAVTISLLTFVCIYGAPQISKKIPGSLVGIIAALWISHAFNMDVPRIGEIPSQLPMPHIPKIHFEDIHTILQSGLTIAVLGSIDTLLTSIVLDAVTRVRHDGDQELKGQGIGNIVSGLIGGLPGAGATMRTMVNVQSGGKTYLSGALHGVILLTVLLGLGKIASQIPTACLAAILVSVGISIMDWRIIKGVKKSPKADTIVMAVVLVLTVFVDLIVAVLVGVALASVLFVKQLSDSQASGHGDMETLEELRLMTEHIPENVRKLIHIYQFTGPLFFGAAKNLTAAVDKLSEARYIMLRFNNVPLIDQTGSYALENAIENWESKGIIVLFVGLPPHIRQTLIQTGAIHKVDMQNCFEHLEQGIQAIDAFETVRTGPG
jgi:sulfate permease, SulP family